MSFAPWVYVVLLGLVLIIYARLLPKKETASSSSSDMMKELEQAMEMFATDMEEQNEALLELFSSTKRDYEGHLAKLSGRLEQLEKQNYQLVRVLSGSKMAASNAEPDSTVSAAEIAIADSAVQPAVYADLPKVSPASPMLMNIKERYAELFRYYEQNKSVEYIAKKLDMNKGEVQLIIRLAKQEEKENV